jgi:hypothetical protein
MNGNGISTEVKPGDKAAQSSNAKQPSSAVADNGAAGKSKAGRKPKVATIANMRYFAGEMKDGKPVLSHEFENEQLAKIESLKTGKPFFSIEANTVKVTGIDPKDPNKFDFILVPVTSEQR